MKYLNTRSGYIPPAPYKVAFFLPKPPPPPYDRWEILRKQAEDLSLEGRLRLEWIIFYETAGKRNVTFTAKYFGISRKTFHKWRKRFENSRSQVRSLIDESRAPHHVRSWQVSLEEEERIVSLRKEHLKYGKKKLKRLYEDKHGEKISTWRIERVIRKHQLYPDRERRAKRIRLQRAKQRRPKKLIKDFKRENILGFLWHLDTIEIWWYGKRRIIFTALEDLVKIGYARIYSSKSSANAKDFLDRLRYLANNQILNSHQDNGSEFEDKFARACRDLKITQIFSRPRQPKDNPALERFNWTVQDEWLSLSEVGLDEINAANRDLTEWLVEYNFQRPHESLSYDSPIVYAKRNYQVSPMWSASTRS